ncbi:MAG: ketopantoate reductase family protein [Candidatus Hodarchaeales archaeon]|jgi:2-dehydropantoate 2-reductase
MRVLFVGAGAIGSLFGGLLAAKEDIWLVGRRQHVEAIEERGLLITTEDRDLRTYPKASVRIPTIKDFDCLVITTKAFDLEYALLPIQKANIKRIPIVILQNGYGNEEVARKILPGWTILRMITTEGAYCPAAGHVIRAGVGRTFIGFSEFIEDEKDFSQRLSQVLTLRGLLSSATGEIDSWIVGKLLVNAAINPICALVGCKNGYILENSDLIGLLKRLVTELEWIALSLKIKLPFDNLQNEVERVLQETAENRCSMLQDILSYRQTEIEFLNGSITNLAKENNCQTPINEALTRLIQGKTKKLLAKEAT